QAAVDAEPAENFLVAREHVAESGKPPARGIRQHEPAGTPTCAFAKRIGLKHQHGFFRRELPQPRRGRKSREAAANHGEIHLVRKALGGGWTKTHRPWRHAPGMRFSRHCFCSMPGKPNGHISGAPRHEGAPTFPNLLATSPSRL